VAELVYFTGPMDCGRSTLAPQLEPLPLERAEVGGNEL